MLWKTTTYSEIFAINCHGVDVNRDGTDDCIVSGRLKDLRAIDPKTGKICNCTMLKHLFLLGYVLLNIQFSVLCLSIIVCPFSFGHCIVCPLIY